MVYPRPELTVRNIRHRLVLKSKVLRVDLPPGSALERKKNEGKKTTLTQQSPVWKSSQLALLLSSHIQADREPAHTSAHVTRFLRTCKAPQHHSRRLWRLVKSWQNSRYKETPLRSRILQRSKLKTKKGIWRVLATGHVYIFATPFPLQAHLSLSFDASRLKSKKPRASQFRSRSSGSVA